MSVCPPFLNILGSQDSVTRLCRRRPAVDPMLPCRVPIKMSVCLFCLHPGQSPPLWQSLPFLQLYPRPPCPLVAGTGALSHDPHTHIPSGPECSVGALTPASVVLIPATDHTCFFASLEFRSGASAQSSTAEQPLPSGLYLLCVLPPCLSGRSHDVRTQSFCQGLSTAPSCVW